MKKHLSLLLIAIFVLVGLNSCYTSNRRAHLPPGQAKKVYGGKSAKRYAPGQQNKKSKKHKKGKGQRGDYHYNNSGQGNRK